MKNADMCRFFEDTDTPKHTLFEYTRWMTNRIPVKIQLGTTLTEQNMIETMEENKQI